MNRFWILLAAAVLVGCHQPADFSPTPTNSSPAASVAASNTDSEPYLDHAQPRLPTIKVFVGSEVLDTEIARAEVEVATGMMYRTNMPEDTAMLFVFPDAQRRAFYMRNCFINLSGAYMDPYGQIVQLIDMKKQDDTSLWSTANNIQFVLEAPEGWFVRHNISPGAAVRTERGTLHETFFGNN